jgi:carbamoyltransferase
VYLGLSIDVDEINKLPKNILQKVTVEQPENTVDELVEDLSSGKVIGLVRGRMEFGPRALCNRSILYKTSDRSYNEWLNERLHRTEFMPFAPVITTELAEKAFIGFQESDITFNFMTSTVNCTDEFSSKCSAVTHIDGTARPHVISKDADPFMWAVISLWFEKTGEYALINTSFNTHEEPIISNVDDALESLLNGTIDVLYVESKRVSLR